MLSSNPHRNDEIKKNDSRADYKDSEGVANAPKCANQSRPHVVALITDDGGDRNDVVGVSRVAHPQKKSHSENGEKADHVFTWNCLDGGCLAQLYQARLQEPQILFHSLSSLSGNLKDRHAWAYSLDVVVRGIPAKFNRCGQINLSHDCARRRC